MNLDEFLKSDHAVRRTKISAFDTEIRVLRVQGVSGRGIANFLNLNNVQVTVSAVNQYFVRHPDRYCISRRSSVAKARDDNTDKSAGASHALTGDVQHPHPDRSGTRKPTPTAVGISSAMPVATARRPLPRASDPACNPAPPADGLSVEGDTADQVPVARHRNTSETASATRSDVARSNSLPGERSNATSNRDTFDARQEGNDTYDGNTKVRRSPLIRYDPNDPKNIAAVASYRQRLRDGQIRTGETTNTNLDRSKNET
ncbi:hypothetical protein VSR68_11010 [Paraburkholderia phymatum]|uniref:hypothetical protein n=1 Tax=Paraburkholderia phymatum TaxID=148447 RepID=UPI00317E048D